VGQPIAGSAPHSPTFIDLLRVYSTDDDVVVVELKLQGTHTGDFAVPGGGVMPATGRKFDVPLR
jgi:hypothetical protein